MAQELTNSAPPVPEEMKIYVRCMTEIRQRIGAIRWAVINVELMEKESFVFAEVVFIQFRKILELVAFASLTANRDHYSAAHATFGDHYKAKLILQAVGSLNPDFYPVPLQPAKVQPEGKFLLEPTTETYLTREDFEYLYDRAGDALHARNPFSKRDPKIDLKYKVTEWVLLIQRLLRFHTVKLAGTESRWLVQVPAEGPVQVLASDAKPPVP